MVYVCLVSIGTRYFWAPCLECFCAVIKAEVWSFSAESSGKSWYTEFRKQASRVHLFTFGTLKHGCAYLSVMDFKLCCNETNVRTLFFSSFYWWLLSYLSCINYSQSAFGNNPFSLFTLWYFILKTAVLTWEKILHVTNWNTNRIVNAISSYATKWRNKSRWPLQKNRLKRIDAPGQLCS